MVLPGAKEDSICLLHWIRENLPEHQYLISIMSQYTPCGRAEQYPEINRRVTKREYEKVLTYICNTDFRNVYIQERNSSDEKYIPPFDLAGV